MINKKTKLEVYERDKSKCVFCGNMEMLERVPHHCFFRSSYFGKDRDDAFNLILICQECHRIIHFAVNDKEAEKGKKLTKKCQEIAIGRYKGENLDKLLIIMRSKYSQKWRFR